MDNPWQLSALTEPAASTGAAQLNQGDIAEQEVQACQVLGWLKEQKLRIFCWVQVGREVTFKASCSSLVLMLPVPILCCTQAIRHQHYIDRPRIQGGTPVHRFKCASSCVSYCDDQCNNPHLFDRAVKFHFHNSSTFIDLIVVCV